MDIYITLSPFLCGCKQLTGAEAQVIPHHNEMEVRAGVTAIDHAPYLSSRSYLPSMSNTLVLPSDEPEQRDMLPYGVVSLSCCQA